MHKVQSNAKMCSSTGYAPIALFAYNRLATLQRTLYALKINQKASDSDLFVFLDGAKTSRDSLIADEIESHVSGLAGFRSVHLHVHGSNIGLKKSILFGVNYMFEHHERVIVLEDDLLVSQYFLDYMNDALELYKNEPDVCQVSGYGYLEQFYDGKDSNLTYFLRGGDCLAWGTWRRAWKYYKDDSEELYKKLKNKSAIHAFNRNGAYPFSSALKANKSTQKSWAINWYASTFLLGKFTLYPVRSHAVHLTNPDEPGTNYGWKTQDPLHVPLAKSYRKIQKISVEVDICAEKKFKKFLRLYGCSLTERVWRRFLNFKKSLRRRVYARRFK